MLVIPPVGEPRSLLLSCLAFLHALHALHGEFLKVEMRDLG